MRGNKTRPHRNAIEPATYSEPGFTKRTIAIVIGILVVLVIIAVTILIVVYFISWCDKGYAGKNCDICDSDFHMQNGSCMGKY